jgi:predicted GNAT family N-acyltransferase
MKTYSQFITEAEKKSHDEVMKTITRNWDRKNPGSNFNVQHRPATQDGKQKEHVYIGLINVNKKERGKKKGSRFVKGITRYADKNKLPVSVKPVAERGYKKKLNTWYNNHGFENNDTKDIAPHPMIRKPK